MKQSLRLLTVVLAMAAVTPTALAQITSTSTSNGGSGGAGGAAAGGTATGGTASNNTSGVSSASGGQGGSSTGGTSSATGGSVGSVSTGGSNAQLGDITVNYTAPAASVPMGKAGLGVGVDPVTGAIVTDSTVTYQGSYKLKNTPDVSVGGPASGPCNGFSGGIGVSMAGFAIGANTSTVDEGCSARETARIAAMIGRMDVANAILDNLPIVLAAMKAKAARDALALPARSSEMPASSSPTHGLPSPAPVQTQEQKEAALKEQQRLAQEALQRQATMAKLNDTLKFTDATTQSSEKSPQEIMAQEAANKQLAANADEAKKAQANGNPATLASQQASTTNNVANGNPAPLATQQASTSNVQASAAPLALQQASTAGPGAQATDRKSPLDSSNISTAAGPTAGAKSETVRTTDSKASLPTATTEDRVKAAKAALNLQ
jgi:hypothetical protein